MFITYCEFQCWINFFSCLDPNTDMKKHFLKQTTILLKKTINFYAIFYIYMYEFDIYAYRYKINYYE